MGDDGDVLKIGKLLAEEGLPFLAEYEHKGSVTCGCVDGSKGHDVEGVQYALRAGEAQFSAVRMTNANLMKAGLGVNADPV